MVFITDVPGAELVVLDVFDRFRSREMFGTIIFWVAGSTEGAELKLAPYVVLPAHAPPPHPTIPVNGTLASASTVTLRLRRVPELPEVSV
jgi:hypothetical protein